ncbi:MAG TPA: class I SAM-dependent methyltransferase [Vicinamibacterales bacterium]|nr:class I SAM-dependent methyltransferase [Vicinamibacterales bacterium]
MYSADLAHIHDAGFSDFSRDVAPHLVAHLPPRGLIVEAGCGSGVLARALTDAGFRVRGFDASPSMIALARTRAPRASFRVATLASAPIPRCDAAIAIGEVITYVSAWRTVTRFFRRVHDALPIGGVFLFDFIESGDRRTYPPKRIAGDDWSIVVRADLSDRNRVLTRRMTLFRKVGRTYRESRATHRVYVRSRDMVAGALRATGFAVTMGRSFGGYRLMPGDVAVVARKR